MRSLLLLLTFVTLFFSCKNTNENNTPKTVKQYTIEQFYKNIRINGGFWSSDESKLLVSSDETGIFNLYQINIADGIKKQITKSDKESFFAAGYVPGTEQMLYLADKGGDEQDHIYLLNTDGTTKDLTPDPKEKADLLNWSQDKKTMYYISNKRNPQFFDIYKTSVNDWKSVMHFQNNDGMEVSGISGDGNLIALQKSVTTSENQLYLYNAGTKEMKEISDPVAKGNYNASGFSKDGQYMDYITNANTEFAFLVRYNISTGEKTKIFETKWDVMYSYNSENEKYRVIGINEDGKNSLKITDNQSGKDVEFPEITDGDIMTVNISDSEKWMRLTVGTSKAPNNIYVYNFETKVLKKLSETLNPEISGDDLVGAEVVRYKSFDGLEIPAIYYKPHNASPNTKVPALVWVHGGPGGQSRVGYSSFIQYLVNNGYAVLAVNNRGSSGYGKSFYKMDDKNHGDKDLKDCIWGKKWLQAQDYVDPEKIGIIGGSYGGYMTMAAMSFTPDEFKVGVNIFGVTNWLRTLKSIPPYWESFRKALYDELGDPTTADSVRLYNISPLFHAQKVKNPVMVLQGSNDPRVLQVESDEIVEAVKKNNVPVEYIVFPDEGHGFEKKENEIKGYGNVLAFLDKYLKGNSKLKD
ncbi:MAG: alpha/beta fold hydrolase [Saprospiraceae bacterium]